MSNKLYVGNIPFSTSEDSLKETFSKCGNVQSVKLITDRMSGRSKGFAFVEMETDAEAQSAIEKLNGTEIEGRPIKVSIAQPQQPGGGGERKGMGGRGGGHGGHKRGFGGGRGHSSREGGGGSSYQGGGRQSEGSGGGRFQNKSSGASSRSHPSESHNDDEDNYGNQ